jgi:hypothetical protein
MTYLDLRYCASGACSEWSLPMSLGEILETLEWENTNLKNPKNPWLTCLYRTTIFFFLNQMYPFKMKIK